MATSQVGWLDMIPGARQGVAYLMSQIANFQRLPARFTQIETAAVSAKRSAETRSDLVTATQLALVLQAVGQIRDQYGNTQSKLADVMDGLRTAGALGLTPVELAASAAQVATEMAAIFQATSEAEGNVYGFASQVMTPQELQSLKLQAPPGSTTSPLAKIGNAALGAVAVATLVIVFFATGGRRRRAA